MSPVEIGIGSVLVIVAMIYMGFYIPVALGVVSVLGVWWIEKDFSYSMNLLSIAVGDSVMEQAFATVPLFTIMGLIVSRAGLGADIYDVMNQVFNRVRGGIGMATVGANAAFAAVTGSSIASASVFTKISVPEMLRLKFNPRFAVGVVAGSSVLGMIIPPSAMLIIYSFVAEQGVGDMFLAGIVPGLMLSGAYILAIMVMGRLTPKFVGGEVDTELKPMPAIEYVTKTVPLVGLVVIVLGGIYTGWLTPIESGAAGAAVALLIAIVRGRMTLKSSGARCWRPATSPPASCF